MKFVFILDIGGNTVIAKNRIHNNNRLTVSLFIFYLILLTWVVVFKLQFSIAKLPNIRNINLIPFGASAIVNGAIDIKEIVYNLLIFIPYGLFIHILWEQKSFIKQFAPIIGTSLLFEVVQFVFSIGGSDITDLITNSLGGILGILLAMLLSKLLTKHWIKLINIISLTGTCLFTLLAATLFLASL